jgi:hypothetical protein
MGMTDAGCGGDMSLFQLWRTGLVNPGRAFEELKAKPAPQWGLAVVVFFNVAISLTTLLALYLLGRGPQMESALTFLPTEHYLVAEMFFLPVLRVGLWLLGSVIIHVGIRLAGKPSDVDLILNIGGLAYLVVMPLLLPSDWLLIALNLYGIGITQYTHGFVALWSMFLSVVGLRRMLGVGTGLALGLSLLSMVTSIMILAIFAR